MAVSPTKLAVAVVRKFVPDEVRIREDEPEPADLAPYAGAFGDETFPVYCQLYMLDGYRDRFEQHPEFDVHFFSRRFVAAEEVALACEEGLVRYPVRVHVGEKVAVLDRTFVTTATRKVPWDADPSVTRFIGSYQFRTRS